MYDMTIQRASRSKKFLNISVRWISLRIFGIWILIHQSWVPSIYCPEAWQSRICQGAWGPEKKDHHSSSSYSNGWGDINPYCTRGSKSISIPSTSTDSSHNSTIARQILRVCGPSTTKGKEGRDSINRRAHSLFTSCPVQCQRQRDKNEGWVIII
jgi:hypothetical protein